MQTSKLINLVLIILLTATIGSAKIWRVDNNGSTPGDFATLADANTGASSGDTLYVYGSPIDYGAMTVTKKLTVIGPGFFLNENPQTQANPARALAGVITFNSGSEGSIMTGLFTGRVIISTNVSDITLKRMRIHHDDHYPTVTISSGCNSITIQQSYITSDRNYGDAEAIEMFGNNTSIIISNNYIDMLHSQSHAIKGVSTSAASITHNVMSGYLAVYYSTFENNILRDGVDNGNNNDYYNNICNGTQFDTTGGNPGNNLTDIAMATVFVGSGSTDGQWQLATGSPAIGTGLEGNDIGMFGGGQPYVLSGIPSIPHIYYLTVPSAAQPGMPLQVRVKAKTND